jgi:glycosyltransferase involved in cell wall biosynthesis
VIGLREGCGQLTAENRGRLSHPAGAAKERAVMLGIVGARAGRLMTPTPLVSIVTPTLNQGRFIEQTIRSIKGQSYPNVEHIVVDGGSTDDTLEILRRSEGTYNLRWLSEPDRGMYDAINKGMRLAGGEILAYLNSDDLYFPWTLEVVVDHFSRHPEADVVFGDVLGIEELSGAEELRLQPPFRYDFLLRAGSLLQPAVFWRRRVHEKAQEFDSALTLAGDLDFWLRLGPGTAYLKIDEVLAVERDHPDAKRSAQWDALIRESQVARARVDRSPAVVRRAGLVVGRFRAWSARRVAWLRFLRAARGRGNASGPWIRYLHSSRLRVSAWRIVVAQTPWLGRRLSSGSTHSGVDWRTGDE